MRRCALVSILFAAFFLNGCATVSTLRIDAARDLGNAGEQAATTTAENIFLSDAACQQVTDIQTLIFSGDALTAKMEQQLETLNKMRKEVHEELKTRRSVFVQLGATYNAFAALAESESPAETETAIKRLGEAVNSYAEAAGKDAPITGSVQRGLGLIGRIAVTELKKRQIKQASILIRERLTAFAQLLNDPAVKEQLIGFQENLASIGEDGVQTLWDEGVLDPSPLLDQIGANIGLRAAPDAAAVARQKKNLAAALNKIILSRLEEQRSLIRANYEASSQAIASLIREHEALEKDGTLNLAALMSIAVAQQQMMRKPLVLGRGQAEREP